MNMLTATPIRVKLYHQTGERLAPCILLNDPVFSYDQMGFRETCFHFRFKDEGDIVAPNKLSNWYHNCNKLTMEVHRNQVISWYHEVFVSAYSILFDFNVSFKINIRK